MKLLNNIFLTIILTSFAFTQQGKNLALDYEKALRLTNANEALKIYESIINTNEDSDYVWLSKLKKAEMLYAKGSYITSSNLLKEFNLNAPLHLQNQSSKDLLFKSFDAKSIKTHIGKKNIIGSQISTDRVKVNNFVILANLGV